MCELQVYQWLSFTTNKVRHWHDELMLQCVKIVDSIDFEFAYHFSSFDFNELQFDSITQMYLPTKIIISKGSNHCQFQNCQLDPESGFVQPFLIVDQYY